MTDSREPVLDLAHLNGFTEGDRQLERELFELFLSSADGYLERMADALAAGHPWQGIVHALKGASANLGARRLAALAQTAEHLEPDPAWLETIRLSLDEIRELSRSRQA